MRLYHPLFFSVQFRHIALCASFFPDTPYFTSSFHHQVPPLLLLSNFFSHTSSHAFKTPSLKCPHKFGAPTSTNLITFSSSHSTNLFFFPQYMYFSQNFLFSSYMYLLQPMHVETPQGLQSHFA